MSSKWVISSCVISDASDSLGLELTSGLSAPSLYTRHRSVARGKVSSLSAHHTASAKALLP